MYLNFLGHYKNTQMLNNEDFRKIPGTEEPGGLQSMGLQRVGHNWVTEQHHSEYIKNIYKLNNKNNLI